MSKVTKKDYENENFLIILNYVETTEPDYIAKDIEQKDQRIAELEKELDELKQNVPTLKCGNKFNLKLESGLILNDFSICGLSYNYTSECE